MLACMIRVRGHVVITFSSAERDRVTRLPVVKSGVGYQNNQCLLCVAVSDDRKQFPCGVVHATHKWSVSVCEVHFVP